jgi:hypothetical protein
MKTIICSVVACLHLAMNTSYAQTSPPKVAAQSVPTLEKQVGLKFVEGKDKNLHLFIDGERVGSIRVDEAWAKSKTSLSVIPPRFWEPTPKKPPKLPDPCIYAICLPAERQQSQIIKFPQDKREIKLIMFNGKK